MIKKFCPRCNKIIDIDKQYCEKHQAEYDAYRAEQKRIANVKYDKTVRRERDKKYYDFYRSKHWEQVKLFIARKYKGLCLYSYLIDKEIMQADVIHHIVEIKADWDLRFDVNNLIPLSNRVHNQIHKRYADNKDEAQEFLKGLLTKWDSEFGGRGV